MLYAYQLFSVTEISLYLAWISPIFIGLRKKKNPCNFNDTIEAAKIQI